MRHRTFRSRALHFLACAAFMLAASLGGCKEMALEGISFMCWSPSGRMLASIYGDAIYVGAPDGTMPLKNFGDLQLAENHLSWSPDSGAIAYTSARSGSWDVWILDINTGQSVCVAKHPAKDQRPYWHPSGKRIIFLSYRSLQPDLWEFDVLSGEVEQLTSDDLEENNLTLSRDGNRLAFRATDSEGASELAVLDLITGERRTVIARSRDLGETAISPDGRQACFVRGGELRLLEIRNLLGIKGERLLVKGTGTEISGCHWSPDGKSILFLRDGRAQIRSLDLFGGIRPLAPSIGRDCLACWSPTENVVAYSTTGESGRPLVAVVNVKTGKREWPAENMADSIEAAGYAASVNCWEEAAQILESGLATFPGDQGGAEAVELLSEAYVRLGRYDKLLEIYKKLALDHVAIGTVYLFCYQDIDRARAEFEKADQQPAAQGFLDLLKKHDRELLKSYCRAELDRRRGEYAKAANEYENFLRSAPDSKTAEIAAFGLGELYEKNLNRPEKALTAYERAISRFPSSPRVEQAEAARARILRHLGRLNDAIIEYESARHSENPEIRMESLTAIANMREEQQDYAGAIPYYRLAAESLPPIPPDSPRADELKKKRLEKQAEFARKVIELDAKLGRIESAQRNARLLLLHIWPSPDERAQALPRLVDAFDRSGLHEAGTHLIEWASREADTEVTFGESLEQWLSMRNYIPRQILIECQLGHLPEWAGDRLKVFADMEASRKGGAGHFEAAILRMITASRPDGIQEMLSSLKPGGVYSDRDVMILTALGNYLLGNFHQTENNTEKAMDCYERMYAAAGDEEFLKILKSYRNLLPSDRHILQRWLDIERETCHGIWKGSERLLGPGLTEEEGRARYERFIQDFPDCPLIGDAYYRAATLAPPGIKKRYLKKVVSDYPGCASFEEAVYELSKEYSRTANWWVFAQFIESIEDKPVQQLHRAFYELWLATIYGETLKDAAEARKHIQVLFDKFRATEEWAMAKRLNATYLMDEEKYQEAIDDIKDLVRERPDDPWVRRGRALQTIAQCHEYMGDWERAELEYLAFLENYREAPDVAAGKVLARIIPKLGDDAIRHHYKKFPEDFVKAAVQLSKEHQEKLYERLPGLRGRVKKTEEEQLTPKGDQP